MVLRTCVENLLQRGVDLCLPGVSGSCTVTVHRPDHGYEAGASAGSKDGGACPWRAASQTAVT
jgi:hypothetical protein